MKVGRDLFSIGGRKNETTVARATLTRVKMFSCWKFIHPSDVISWDKNPEKKKKKLLGMKKVPDRKFKFYQINFSNEIGCGHCVRVECCPRRLQVQFLF